MTTLETKKLRVLEHLARTNEEDIFDKVQQVLDEEGKNYTVPLEHLGLLEEEHEKYVRGELKTSTWDEIEQRLKIKYGL